MKLKNIKLTLRILCVFSILSTSTLMAMTSNQDAKAGKQVTTKGETESTQSFDHIVELLPEDFKPAFTQSTVLKLNAIVKRSYAIIREYDEMTQGVEKAMQKPVSQRSSEQLKALVQHKLTVSNSLQVRSEAALIDMKKAVKTLKASNEHYNAAVLAGMFTFVETVEKEVHGLL